MDRVRVTVPASSANLGPGFDVLAAAVGLELELVAERAAEFSIDPGDGTLPADRSNLCVRAFESLIPADGFAIVASSAIPLARGLGSSAAAIVAGLVAADALGGLGLGRDEIYRRAVALEGHPDNVGAALYGGFVVCPQRDDGELDPPVRLRSPAAIAAIVAIPYEEVSTSAARAALPDQVPIADAVANVSSAAQLVLGIERSSHELIARGLADRLHQPHRASLYPRSMELVDAARQIGAIGAAISGAGPTVLIWAEAALADDLAGRLGDRSHGWADVTRIDFDEDGARVETDPEPGA